MWSKEVMDYHKCKLLASTLPDALCLGRTQVEYQGMKAEDSQMLVGILEVISIYIDHWARDACHVTLGYCLTSPTSAPSISMSSIDSLRA